MLNKISHFNVRHFTKQHPLSLFGQRIVQIGQKEALGAILKHKALGNPIYCEHSTGRALPSHDLPFFFKICRGVDAKGSFRCNYFDIYPHAIS